MKSNEIVLNEINDMLSLHPEFSKGSRLKRGQSMVVKSQGMKNLKKYDTMNSNESSYKVSKTSPQFSPRSVKNVGSMD